MALLAIFIFVDSPTIKNFFAHNGFFKIYEHGQNL